LAIIAAGIIRSSSGVFIVPFEKEFGWDRPVISLAFAISLFLYGLSGPFMAALIEVLGLKRMMILAMTTLLSGIVLTFFMQDSWQLILIWGVIIGLGSGLFLTVLSPYVEKAVPHEDTAFPCYIAWSVSDKRLLFTIMRN
jgi:MFS family permease